jgi:hypothetical protein
MVAAGIWKRQDIDRIEASLYRKVLGIGNMISNKAILNTMTSIRLAEDVVSYLSKEAWELFRRQNRVTACYDKRETEGSYSTRRSNNYKEPEEKRLPKKEEIWISKNLYSLMLATTANSTSVHFGMNNLCKKHNKLSLHTRSHRGV